MPSVFFDKTDKITTLHIYNPQSVLPRISHRGYSGVDANLYHMSWAAKYDLGPSASDMVLELMAGWSKTCPKLTEVKWEKERLLCRRSPGKEEKWLFAMDTGPVEVDSRQECRRRMIDRYW